MSIYRPLIMSKNVCVEFNWSTNHRNLFHESQLERIEHSISHVLPTWQFKSLFGWSHYSSQFPVTPQQFSIWMLFAVTTKYATFMRRSMSKRCAQWYWNEWLLSRLIFSLNQMLIYKKQKKQLIMILDLIVTIDIDIIWFFL